MLVRLNIGIDHLPDIGQLFLPGTQRVETNHRIANDRLVSLDITALHNVVSDIAALPSDIEIPLIVNDLCQPYSL